MHPTNKFERKVLSEKKKARRKVEGSLRHKRVILEEQETADALKRASSLQGFDLILD